MKLQPLAFLSCDRRPATDCRVSESQAVLDVQRSEFERWLQFQCMIEYLWSITRDPAGQSKVVKGVSIVYDIIGVVLQIEVNYIYSRIKMTSVRRPSN